MNYWMLSGQIFQFSECQCLLMRYAVFKKKNTSKITLNLKLTVGSSNFNSSENEFILWTISIILLLCIFCVGSLEGIPLDYVVDHSVTLERSVRRFS